MKLNKEAVIRIYRDYLISLGIKEKTVKQKTDYACRFFEYLDRYPAKDNTPFDVRDIGTEQIKNYILKLYKLKNRITGMSLCTDTRIMMIVALKQMFKCLYTGEYILLNPMQNIRIKKRKDNRKKTYLSQREMVLFLECINGGSCAVRDRVIFELMYSSGFRIGEIARLKIEDIDFDNRMVMIRKGKNGKDRIEPINEVSVILLKSYLKSRINNKIDYVFGKIGIPGIRERFKKWVVKAGVMKKGLSVHSIRHSVAVHLLENGANVRYVQELLGHESLQTTVTYTHSSTERLHRVYKTYHPRENGYYLEVDGEYREKVGRFKEVVQAWNGNYKR